MRLEVLTSDRAPLSPPSGAAPGTWTGNTLSTHFPLLTESSQLLKRSDRSQFPGCDTQDSEVLLRGNQTQGLQCRAVTRATAPLFCLEGGSWEQRSPAGLMRTELAGSPSAGRTRSIKMPPFLAGLTPHFPPWTCMC